MKICIYGAGAVGGHLAARLITAGHDEVSLVARGAQLRAIQQNGLKVFRGEETYTGRPFAATDDPTSLPLQDVVLVTLKAQALPGAAAAIERLLAKDGVAVFAVNGIPWWWNKGTNNVQEHLECVDPGGELWSRLKDRSLGCVIYSPNEVIEPGVIKTAMGDRWVFGEPDNSPSSRVDRLVQAFQAANINGVAATDLRYDIWHKLLINCGLNPVAALTRLPTAKMTASPEVRAERCKVMLEVLEVALACGTDLRGKVDLEELVAPRKRPGSNTASMLQDVMAGRSLEHDAILGQVVEFARQHNISVPRCELMLVLLRGLNQQLMDEAAART